MKEVMKVRVAETTFAMDKEAYGVLAALLEEVEQSEGKEAASKVESDFVAHVLEKQSVNTVLEVELVRNIVLAMGYTPKAQPQKPHTTTQPATIESGVGPLGKVFIVCAKVLLGIFLAGWILAAIGLLIGFVTLIAIGDIWAEYLTLPLEGISPVVFAGLVCAVVVLFMGIVADLGWRLIAGRRVNLRKLAVSGVVWLIFFLWLIFTSVRNADNWVIWAHESTIKIEQWERDFELWEERLEEQLEDAIFNPTLVDGAETHLTFYLYELGDSLKLDKLCEEFDELYRYDDHIIGFLIDGKEVVIDVVISQQDNEISRQTTITTPSGTTTINVSLDGRGKLIDYKTNQQTTL